MQKSEETAQIDISFPNDSAKTGIVYDPIFLKHTLAIHPERARRLISIFDRLKETGLNKAVGLIPSRPATMEELRLNHSDYHILRVQSMSAEGGGNLDADTYVNEFSYDAAVIAAGSLIDLTLAVARGDLQNGFALVRPPGHHAMTDYAMGFCLFNNVAIAVCAALKSGVNKIAIVDFDVHHGNGTQAVFENNPNVLFISTHQSPHYPGTGAITETGEIGQMINIPLPADTGDFWFRAIYDEVIIPLLQRFSPQMILISAGYDGHWADPLASLGLTCAGQAWISEMLVHAAKEICQGRIVFSFEGGYHPTALSAGVANSLRVLLGRDDYQDPLGPPPRSEPDCRAVIDEVKRIHRL